MSTLRVRQSLLALVALAMIGVGARAAAAPLVVSISIDDGYNDAPQFASLLEARGLRATFFIVSGYMNYSGYMTPSQLRTLEAAGHEIGGHTMAHRSLVTLSADEARREVCGDRATLVAYGLHPVSFSYPFGEYGPTAEQVVAQCGYNSGRIVGPITDYDAPAAETIPPQDPFALITPWSVENTMSLAEIEGWVTDAEASGGWLIIVFHHLCQSGSSCDQYGITTSNFTTFLDWLNARAGRGTTVRLIRDVVGGAQQPLTVLANPVINPSLETNGVPLGWQRVKTGTNNASWSTVRTAHSGSYAQRVSITSYSSGGAQLMQRLDLYGQAAFPGHRYTVSGWYTSTAQPRWTAYYRDQNGAWFTWTQSPAIAAASSWTSSSWTTPALPSNATGLSFGLALTSTGTLTVDDFGLAEQGQAPTEVSLTSPANGATVSGTVALAATATSSSGIVRVDFLAGGAVVGSDATAPYSASWDTTQVANGSATLTARALDGAGATVTSAPVQVTVSNAVTQVALTSPAGGATVSGTVSLAASASSPSGIVRVDFLAGGAVVGSDTSSPYSVSWNTTQVANGPVTLTASALDGEGATVVSAPVQVTVSNAATQVALTAPASGATLSGTATLTASASSPSGVVRVDFLAGTAVVGSDTTAPYSVSWNTTQVADGPATLTARVLDGAGATVTSAPVQVTVSNVVPAPQVALTSPAGGATLSGTVTLAADATSPTGVVRVDFLAGGLVVGSDATSPYSVSWDTTLVGDGPVALTASALDGAGATVTSAPVQVTVSNLFPVNLVKNPSLETDVSPADGIPDCWLRARFGTNTTAWTTTSDAHAGAFAQRVDISSYSSGAARLVPSQDSGTCAPAGVAGHRYRITAWYKSTVQPRWVGFYRNASGAWVWWAQTALLSPASAWAQSTWDTPALPAGATHLSFGLSLYSTGSLTVDDFTLTDLGP